jgi:spermidine synthase
MMPREYTLSQWDDPSRPHRFLPLLLVLFIGSGCSALIYEVVWLQSLQLVIGSSAVSLGVLLGTFMGGMCLGSLVLPRIISTRRHPLRVYAALELGIGIAGIAVLFGMPYVDRLYAAHVHPGLASVFLRGAVCAVCLLPPTLLMGATLPAIARWVEATPRGVSWLGLFYGGNIAGAVFGCLLAGFYLLRVYDIAIATYVAATVNLTVAVIALFLAARTVHQAPADQAPQEDVPLGGESQRPAGAGIVYGVIALSGLTALGAEVVWTRILSLLLGGTVYTFSIILAVFLLGLGIGSSIGSMIARHSERPRAALAGCQLLLMGAIAWTAYALAKSLPYWPVDPSLSTSPWFTFQLDLMRCVWAVLPGTILWGASFPLALASVVCSRPARASGEMAQRGTANEPGRLVGGVYAANTIGAILGSLGFSMVLVPWLGTRGCQGVMIALSAVSAMLILLPALARARAVGIAARLAGLAGAAAAAVVLIWSLPTTPWGLTAYGRYMATWNDALVPGVVDELEVPPDTTRSDLYCIYAQEGMSVSVAVTQSTDGVRSFHGAGKVQASTEPQDMRLQRMLGHIPALVHSNPESVLVVACGAGVTAGSFVVHPTVKRIVICDIEPLVPKYVAPFFKKENYDVVNDPRTEVVCDDGRHFISTTHEKFDIITSDPIDPWVKGCAALNTEEYYETCKRHLNPGGVMALWVPLYESNTETVKSLFATFFKVFPNGILWSNDISGEGYDAVLFGQVEPTQIDVDRLQERLDRPEYVAVLKSLAEVGFHSVDDLLATYAGQGVRLQEWMRDAQINTDRNLRLQYLAGLSLNSSQGKAIFSDILAYYDFPGDLFLGSSGHVAAIQKALDHAGRSAHVRP